ncbi:MAG TPA: prolyl oligopeptidase family serine peptidase, partial [Tepidisphaeraceae bacterium]|nr:prolyl oligopeptidase family serine peptidase [Tepidisphaeraceae bacterium]
FGALDAGEMTELPEVPPLTIRKVPFQIKVPDPLPPQNPTDLAFELLGPDGSLDTATVSIRIRKPNEVYKRTFISRIDGSVQYYAVNPAQKPSDSNALILTLHGASVEALGQASAYKSKDWVTLVAPTNRRPYGFDWEGIGERDALEVLEIAKKTIAHDPRRVILAGHSMGGHGTWHIGLTYPDLFAAIGPSAGWSSFTSYAGRRAGGSSSAQQPSPMQQLFARAASTSDTLALVRNSLAEEVYILHGSADDNVPVTEARLMRHALDEIHHPRLSYHEQPGAGHWWGSLCVDWPPMFAMFDEARLPELGKVNQIEFVTMNPAVSGRCDWVTIEQQVEPMKPSRISFTREGDRVRGTTENVQTLQIDLATLGGAMKELELDGHEVTLGDHASAAAKLVVARHEGHWTVPEGLDPAEKNARRSGPFKLAFDNDLMLVYGTHGGEQDAADAYHAARLFAETLDYRGGGAVDCVPDVAFDPGKSRDRNVMLFGNADSNSAWPKLLAKCPIQVRNGSARAGDRTFEGADLAALLIYPRPDSDTALVAAVGFTGHAASYEANALPLLVSGVGFPDWMIAGADSLTTGTPGVRGAGFFANDWWLNPADTVWGAPVGKERSPESSSTVRP